MLPMRSLPLSLAPRLVTSGTVSMLAVSTPWYAIWPLGTLSFLALLFRCWRMSSRLGGGSSSRMGCLTTPFWLSLQGYMDKKRWSPLWRTQAWSLVGVRRLCLTATFPAAPPGPAPPAGPAAGLATTLVRREVVSGLAPAAPPDVGGADAGAEDTTCPRGVAGSGGRSSRAAGKSQGSHGKSRRSGKRLALAGTGQDLFPRPSGTAVALAPAARLCGAVALAPAAAAAPSPGDIPTAPLPVTILSLASLFCAVGACLAIDATWSRLRRQSRAFSAGRPPGCFLGGLVSPPSCSGVVPRLLLASLWQFLF